MSETETQLGTFTLTVKLGNDAMTSPDDIADALEAVAVSVRARAEYPRKIRDYNGNTVGSWTVTPASTQWAEIAGSFAIWDKNA